MTFSALPNELALNIFVYIPDASLSSVCQQWNTLLVDKLIWKPVLREISPDMFQKLEDGQITSEVKEVVKSYFIAQRSDIHFIVDLIKDDEQLAKCLHTERWTLAEFKNKTAFERSRLIWKAMHKDATPTLVHILAAVYPSLKEKMALASDEHGRFETLNSFIVTERLTPVVRSLIEIHKVQYKQTDLICALIPLFFMSKNDILITNIIRSHADLSELRNKDCVRPQPIFTDFSPEVKVNALLAFARIAESLSIDHPFTQEDLEKCKLFDALAND